MGFIIHTASVRSLIAFLWIIPIQAHITHRFPLNHAVHNCIQRYCIQYNYYQSSALVPYKNLGHAIKKSLANCMTNVVM